MDYFKSTYFDSYTALTKEQIREKLTPVPRPAGGVNSGLSGKQLTLGLDSGRTFHFTFRETYLQFTEDSGAPIRCPYGARELRGIRLAAFMVPDTMRGYVLVLDVPASLCTVFEIWFGGYEPALREVWREYATGCIVSDGDAPAKRHALSNRIEGLGTHWYDDDGRETLYFFPSVVGSAFIELSDPRCGVTLTAPSDYLQINDSCYIYSRTEHEFSGAFTLEVLDLLSMRHVGVRIGFDLGDELDFHLYGGRGEFIGKCTNLEMLTDYGRKIPFDEKKLKSMAAAGRGARPVYRPRLTNRDFSAAEVNEIIDTNLELFKDSSVMSSRNTMEVSDYMVGRRFTLSYDDGSAWEYEFPDKLHLRWREAGDPEWTGELTKAFEPAKDILLFSHICSGTRPLRCLTQVVDFSNGLATCVDAQLGNGRKPREVGHRVMFGVLEMEGGPTPPILQRHGFTNELLGKCFAWTYGELMQSIHCYTSPGSCAWTIILPGNAGGLMWSSPCLYIKLREDAYLISWTEDDCNGNQGTIVFNPWIMHDAGYFFGISDMGEKPNVHLHEIGAFARPLAGFDLARFYEQTQKREY